MLLKTERKVLKQVLKQPNENSISAEKFNNYCEAEIFEAFKTLKDKGYFEMVDTVYGYSSFSYVLTTQGRCYKEYAFRKFMANIVIPIIVSLLTTIGTLYLEKLAENNEPKKATEYTSNYPDGDF